MTLINSGNETTDLKREQTRRLDAAAKPLIRKGNEAVQ
jgi:hypothetical protein